MMARIRTVKPDFFLHEGLYDLEQETGWPMRIAYQGLWCQADREGRFPWQPRKLKSQVCPYDELDFSRVLDALATRGFLVKYACRGQLFGAIPTFKTHQVINNKERDSVLPDFTANDCETMTCTDEARVLHALTTRDSKERKGKEGNKIPPKSPKGDRGRFQSKDVPIPDGWSTDIVRPVLADWLEHKRSLGKPYKSAATAGRLLAKFAKDHGTDGQAKFLAAVEHSIAMNYAGCFPPNDSKATSTESVRQRAMTSEELREWKP